MMPQTIRAEASPEAITKVTRLFNGSAVDVLAELFQNARRAEAGAVDVCISGVGKACRSLVRDDGRGIDDPSDNLALGRSGWDAPTRAAEDPAGIGFFALAGLDVVVRAWSAAAGCGWRARIAGSCWEGRGEVEVIPDAIAAGTEIVITVPEPWSGRSPLPFAPPRATCRCPFRSTVNRCRARNSSSAPSMSLHGAAAVSASSAAAPHGIAAPNPRP